MKQLALFLVHFFWLCYTVKEKQTHSKSRHSQAPHLQSAVELFRSPDSILYLFKHRCFYIYMKALASKGTKPSPDSIWKVHSSLDFLLESTRYSVSLVLFYIGPNDKCWIWRIGNLQCLHMVSGSDIPLVLLLVSMRDRKSSHLQAKPAENRDPSPSEPCCAFSDCSLKARCPEHKVLAATHCSGFSKWNCFAKQI